MPVRAEVAIRLNGHEVATIDAGTVDLGINVTSAPDGLNVTIDSEGSLAETLRAAVENALTGLVADKEPEPEHSGWACPHGFSAERCTLDCTPTETADPACTNHKPVQHRDGKTPWCNACGSFVAGRLSWHREPSSLPCAHVIPVDEGSPTACTKCGKTFHLTRTEGDTQQAPETPAPDDPPVTARLIVELDGTPHVVLATTHIEPRYAPRTNTDSRATPMLDPEHLNGELEQFVTVHANQWVSERVPEQTRRQRARRRAARFANKATASQDDYQPPNPLIH